MARITGVDLPRGKRIEIALTYIFGIGRSTARKILDEIDEASSNDDWLSVQKLSNDILLLEYELLL